MRPMPTVQIQTSAELAALTQRADAHTSRAACKLDALDPIPARRVPLGRGP